MQTFKIAYMPDISPATMTLISDLVKSSASSCCGVGATSQYELGAVVDALRDDDKKQMQADKFAAVDDQTLETDIAYLDDLLLDQAYDYIEF